MALREINIVPPDLLYRLQLRRHMGFWTLCLSAILLLIFGFHFYQARLAMARKTAPSALGDTQTLLLSKIEKVRQVQEEIERLGNYRNALEAVTGSAPFSAVLSRLAGMMDGRTWLTLLAIDRGSDAGADTTLRLTGYSARNDILGDFLNRLSMDPLFDAVSLKYARETPAAGDGEKGEGTEGLIQFQVECILSRS